MFNALQKGWIPPSHISEEEYNRVRDNKDQYPDYYVGYVGFNATFGAKYFGGYARGFKADGVTPRDYREEAYRNLIKQLPYIADVKFICSDYLDNEYNNLHNALIYCDPPYQGTTKYSTETFNNDTFWNWCRKMSKDNKVFVSEYNAPKDFTCIWEKQIISSLKIHHGDENKIERLYTI